MFLKLGNSAFNTALPHDYEDKMKLKPIKLIQIRSTLIKNRIIIYLFLSSYHKY